LICKEKVWLEKLLKNNNMTSAMGTSSEQSLPEDIEKELANVQGVIKSLSVEKDSLKSEVEQGRQDLEIIKGKISDANKILFDINSTYQSKLDDLKKKENYLTEKESSLEVYSNSLKDKELKINRLLQAFNSVKRIMST